MDGNSFDRIARLVAGPRTRRAGLAGALGALVALTGGVAADAAARREHGPSRGGGEASVISESRPCGPKASDNKCRKDADCCTRYCKSPKGKHRAGRCRCIQRGKPCRNGQTCCGGGLCANGRCAPACGVTGAACANDETCCAGLVCTGGACGPCIPTVCASGCDYTDVNAAYAAASAGDTIYIGPGEYPTGIKVNKDITLAACPDETDVKLVPDRAFYSDSYSSRYSIVTNDSADPAQHAVTLRNLTLEGSAAGKSGNDEVLVHGSYDYSTLSYTIDGCRLTSARQGLEVYHGNHVVADSTIEDCRYGISVEFGSSRSDPMSLTMAGSSIIGTDTYAVQFRPLTVAPGALTMTDCTISGASGQPIHFVGNENDAAGRATTTATLIGCTFSGNGLYSYFANGVISLQDCAITDNPGGGAWFVSASATLTDTTVSGNQSSEGGAGIRVVAAGLDAALTVNGATTVTGNTSTSTDAPAAGGIYSVVSTNPKTVTITGTTTANVTGNSPVDCVKKIEVSPNQTANCGTWA